MPRITITYAWDVAFCVGQRHGFQRGGENFEGVICGVWPADARHLDITLEMTPAEHTRMVAALGF